MCGSSEFGALNWSALGSDLRGREILTWFWTSCSNSAWAEMDWKGHLNKLCANWTEFTSQFQGSFTLICGCCWLAYDTRRMKNPMSVIRGLYQITLLHILIITGIHLYRFIQFRSVYTAFQVNISSFDGGTTDIMICTRWHWSRLRKRPPTSGHIFYRE